MQRIISFCLVTISLVSFARAQDAEPTGPKPARVEVTPRMTEVEAGQQVSFSAAGYDEAGNKIDAKPTTWFASPFDVAYSDDQGVVTFVLPGEVRVGAIINGKAGFLLVTVKPQPVARIDLQSPAAPIPIGAGIPLHFVTRMANGDPRTDVQVTWSSLNPTIATVDDSGLVTGIAVGLATIQAAAGDIKSAVRVNIVRNPVRSLAVEPKTTKVRT